MKKQMRILTCMVISMLLILNAAAMAFASSGTMVETELGTISILPISEESFLMSDGQSSAIVNVQETEDVIYFSLTEGNKVKYLIYNKDSGQMYSSYTGKIIQLEEGKIKISAMNNIGNSTVSPMGVKGIVETTEYKVSYAQIADAIGDSYSTYDLAFTIVAIIGVFQGVALTTITAAVYGALKGSVLTTVLDGVKNRKSGGVKLQIHLCEITKHQGGRVVTGYGYKLGDIGPY